MTKFGLPKVGQKVFVTGDYKNMAHIPSVSYSGNHELLDRYYNGFKLIADTAVDNLLENAHANMLKDQLVFPIIFNYRHFIELILKKYAIKYKIEKIDLNNLGHSLMFYWKVVKPLLLEVHKEQKDVNEVISATESYIEEFSELDSGSFRFRYPFSKGESLTPSFDEDFHVDYVQLKYRMNELYNILEYLEDYLIEE